MSTTLRGMEPHTILMIDSDALQEMMREDRKFFYERGMMDGMKKEADQRQRSFEPPLSKEEAARSLNVSPGTIDNMRKRGELESMEYNSRVYIEREEILRYKRTHRSLYVAVEV